MDLLVVTVPGWPSKKGGALLEPFAVLLPEPSSVTQAMVRDGAVVVPATTDAVAVSPAAPPLQLSEALQARSAWIEEQAQLTAAAARPLAVTSPSRLEDLEFRELRNDEERLAFASARRTALALGSAVHRVMEGVSFGDPEALQAPSSLPERLAERAAKTLSELGVETDTELTELVARHAVACWLSTPVRQAAASSRVYRELPLCVRVHPHSGGGPGAGDESAGEPPLVEGFCDLLYRAPDGWVVVDYKTDRRTDDEAIRRQYELQAGAYALAVEQITGERVSRACFVLAGAAQPGQPAPVVEFPVTDDLLARVRARISEAAAQGVPMAD